MTPYTTKFLNANDLPITADPNEMLYARHNVINKDVIEVLFFKIKVYLDDDFSDPDETTYINDFNPTILPTFKIFPDIANNFYASSFACFPDLYEFNYIDDHLIEKPPL